VTAGANTTILQSHYHSPYTPGRGQLVFITFSMPNTVPANGERGVGYYDGNDGIFLKETVAGLTLNCVSTTDAADQSIDQADWNLDPMDGTGLSGITLDVSKTNILVIQLQALYVDRVVVGFDIGGSLIPVHAFEHANIIAAPYIAQASLPVRYWSSTSTDVTSCVINSVCCSVISEGGDNLEEMSGRQFAVGVENTSLSSPAGVSVLSLQCQEQIGTIDQNALVLPVDISASVVTSGAWISILINSTYSPAPTWNVIDSGSSVKYATNSAINVAGRVIDTFYVPAAANVRASASSGLLGKVAMAYSHLLAKGDTLDVTVTSSGNPDVWISMKWKEIR